MDNLELWNKVCVTDIGDTKSFKGKGGFKGTAIDAQSQRKKATEIFGIFGIGWKVDNESYNIVHLNPNDAHYSKIFYTAYLRFNYDGVDGGFPIASELDVFTYSRNYDSWTMGNDLYKKVRTDAMTKGLSELGFNADVFEGKFDDNKYIQDLKDKEGQKNKPPYDMDRSIQKFESCKDLNALKDMWKKLYKEFDGNTKEMLELTKWKDQRKKELTPEKPPAKKPKGQLSDDGPNDEDNLFGMSQSL